LGLIEKKEGVRNMKNRMFALFAVLLASLVVVSIAGQNVMEPIYLRTDKGTVSWTNSVGGPALLQNVVCTPKATTECTNTIKVISNSGAITNFIREEITLLGSNTTAITKIDYVITDGDVIVVSNGPTGTYVNVKIDIRDRRDGR
jgi:hypothetical protein